MKQEVQKYTLYINTGMLNFFLRKLQSVHLLVFKRTLPLCFRERVDTINLQFLRKALTLLRGIGIPTCGETLR
jgi:hypothetical protein